MGQPATSPPQSFASSAHLLLPVPGTAMASLQSSFHFHQQLHQQVTAESKLNLRPHSYHFLATRRRERGRGITADSLAALRVAGAS